CLCYGGRYYGEDPSSHCRAPLDDKFYCLALLWMTKKTNVIQSVSEESHTDWARPHVNSPMVPGVLSAEDPSSVNCLWMTEKKLSPPQGDIGNEWSSSWCNNNMRITV
ncbi:MAG: hypothetical protein WCS64_00630, partial [Dehalococcoidales bacterium]